MILLFLGSWRSTLIIAVSIPLSILTSVMVLSALGETINIMTLGGLALAVGILVDDATVTIENIDKRYLEDGPPLREAILNGASQIAAPGCTRRFASASCSCRCSCCKASHAIYSCRWRRRWCSRAPLPIFVRSFRRWRCICCGTSRMTRRARAIRW